jgi:hypothetical protein
MHVFRKIIAPPPRFRLGFFRNRFLAGVFAVFLVVLASCADAVIPDEPIIPDEPVVPKSIKISDFPTGYPYFGNIAMVTLLPSMEGDIAAVGALQVIGGTTLTFSLKTDETLATDWTGTGVYSIFLSIINLAGNTEKLFVYTNSAIPNQDGSDVPKQNFTDRDELTTLSFNGFFELLAP